MAQAESYLWTGDEMAEADRRYREFVDRWGEKPDGLVTPWPGTREDIAKAAFLAGWIARGAGKGGS